MVKTLAEHGVEAADITEDELLTAVQNAIWYFANRKDNVIKEYYSGTLYHSWNKEDTKYYDAESNKYSRYSTLQSIDTVKTNITNVYNYLINIAPESASWRHSPQRRDSYSAEHRNERHCGRTVEV